MSATERFPVFAGLAVESSGVSCAELRARAVEPDDAELEEAIRFVLVEYLTVFGNLTADIFTPALREELSTVALGTAPRRSQTARGRPGNGNDE